MNLFYFHCYYNRKPLDCQGVFENSFKLFFRDPNHRPAFLPLLQLRRQTRRPTLRAVQVFCAEFHPSRFPATGAELRTICPAGSRDYNMGINFLLLVVDLDCYYKMRSRSITETDSLSSFR